MTSFAFDHIYFDSNSLRDGGWPRSNVKLENVAGLARAHEIKCFIPEPVEREMEEQWIRDYVSLASKAEQAIQNINNYATGIAPQLATPSILQLEAARKLYRSMADATKTKLGILTAPFTERSLRELHEMSVCRVPPFKEKDKHFQDVVIYLSIYDHLELAKCRGVLVSGDAIFGTPQFAGIDQSATTRISIARGLSEMASTFEEELARREVEQFNKLRASLAEALNSKANEIANLVNETVSFVPDDLALLSTVVEFRGARNPKVAKVIIPWELSKGETVKFYSDVEVELVGVVERYVPPEQPPLKPGPQIDQNALMILQFLGGKKERQPISTPKTIHLSGTAMFTGEAFQDIRLESAYVDSTNADAFARMLSKLAITPSSKATDASEATND